LRQRDIRFWQTERRAVGTLAYPFSRSERLELSSGYQNISFTSEIETRLIDQNDNVVQDNTNPQDVGLPNLNLIVSDVAWVHDNAFFGGTS
ncbi:hypothetical protein NL529_28865, partial [Klebsiella pneumoniae]|nr:hypothetical protein [Klebsiella pneumoniae]